MTQIRVVAHEPSRDFVLWALFVLFALSLARFAYCVCIVYSGAFARLYDAATTAFVNLRVTKRKKT
jgi:hypothetical protein